jgi:hypothetical protein
MKPDGHVLASSQRKLSGRSRGMKLNRTMQKQEHSVNAITSLTLGADLLVAGLAFAQTPATTDSSSSDSDIRQSNAPANNTPSEATDANGGGATAQSISQACEKQASDKKLSGDDKSTLVNKCKMGKTTRQDQQLIN